MFPAHRWEEAVLCLLQIIDSRSQAGHSTPHLTLYPDLLGHLTADCEVAV